MFLSLLLIAYIVGVMISAGIAIAEVNKKRFALKEWMYVVLCAIGSWVTVGYIINRKG
jgi:hypothetical protein